MSDSPDTPRWLDRLREHKHSALLAALLLLAVLYPLLQAWLVRPWLFDTLFCFMLATAAFAVSHRRVLFLIALVLALPSISLIGGVSAAGAAAPRGLVVADYVLQFAFLAFVASAILDDVLRASRVTPEQIAGAICVYLLLGFTWASIYSAVDRLNPDAFAQPAEAADDPARRESSGEFIYFSFVTLTTLGYGDITPVSPAARTFAWLEAVVGQLFLAVLIARLVALGVAHRE